jgi:glutaredoxin-like protein
MALFNQETTDQLKDIFTGLKEEVTIALFTDEECDSCGDTKEFMSEVEALSEKINLNTYSLKDQGKDFGIDKAPAIKLLDKDKKDHGVVFYGIPAGHEINSFIAGLMELSGSGETLPTEFKTQLDAVKKPVNIKVFVTLACPHCSGAVAKAHKLAYENEHIHAEMIECGTFPELANEYQVSGVPKIVFNDKEELVGNQPFDQFVEKVLNA